MSWAVSRRSSSRRAARSDQKRPESRKKRPESGQKLPAAACCWPPFARPKRATTATATITTGARRLSAAAHCPPAQSSKHNGRPATHEHVWVPLQCVCLFLKARLFLRAHLCLCLSQPLVCAWEEEPPARRAADEPRGPAPNWQQISRLISPKAQQRRLLC